MLAEKTSYQGSGERSEEKNRNVRAAGLDVAPVGHVNLVHLGKVVHGGEEDVDLDDLFEGGAGGLEDGLEVLDALVLRLSAAVHCIGTVLRRERSYSVSLDITGNQLHGLGVHGDGARDKDHAVGLDGLAVDAGEGLGGLVGEDGFLGRGHCVVCVRKVKGENVGK